MATAAQDAGGLPAEAGCYAWWAEPECLPGLPHVPHALEASFGLFYVGISPRDAQSQATLRSRVIGQHIGGNTSSSTFRYVIAALLMEELNLTPRRTAKKVVLDRGDNGRLPTWQRQHLRLTWAVREPWDDDHDMIRLMAPPPERGC